MKAFDFLFLCSNFVLEVPVVIPQHLRIPLAGEYIP